MIGWLIAGIGVALAGIAGYAHWLNRRARRKRRSLRHVVGIEEWWGRR